MNSQACDFGRSLSLNFERQLNGLQQRLISIMQMTEIPRLAVFEKQDPTAESKPEKHTVWPTIDDAKKKGSQQGERQ